MDWEWLRVCFRGIGGRGGEGGRWAISHGWALQTDGDAKFEIWE